jgi:hypothetical protein
MESEKAPYHKETRPLVYMNKITIWDSKIDQSVSQQLKPCGDGVTVNLAVS